jgi:hypothetical protein
MLPAPLQARRTKCRVLYCNKRSVLSDSGHDWLRFAYVL